MGRRGKQPPAIWATSGGFVADHEPKLTREEAGAILGAEIPAEAWNRIHWEVTLLNIRLSELAELPRANANRNDPRSLEKWRERALAVVERAAKDLRALRGDRLQVTAAREVAVENHMAQPRVQRLDGEARGAEWQNAREAYDLRKHLEAALEALFMAGLVLDRAEGAKGIRPMSEAELRARCVREIAAALREAGLPVEGTSRAVIDAARGTLNLEGLTPFERLIAELEVLPDRAPAALADAIREALGKKWCDEAN